MEAHENVSFPEEVAGPWPLPWDSCVKGQMVPATMGYPQDHVAESFRVGSPCLWAVFVGCGESNKQIFLGATPLLQLSRNGQSCLFLKVMAWPFFAPFSSLG